MSRSLARELAFIAIFQLDFNHGSDEDDEDREFYENLAIDNVLFDENAVSEEKKIGSSNQRYIKKTVRGVRQNLTEIDELISERLKRGWTLNRLASMDLNILRLAVYEIKFAPKAVPVGIAINEAVELAKKYGTDESSRFVNGILAAIAK